MGPELCILGYQHCASAADDQCLAVCLDRNMQRSSIMVGIPDLCKNWHFFPSNPVCFSSDVFSEKIFPLLDD